MERKIFILAGLGYGDEGKGTVADFLTSVFPVESIWRYNGGAQAAHYVTSPEGIVHCFSQFGSGSLSKPVSSVLSRFTAINPISLFSEHKVLQEKIHFPLPEINLDARALVVTPYHSLINQMREISRGKKRVGSCGRGIGETFRDVEGFGDKVLRIGDLGNLSVLKHKLNFLRLIKIDQAEQLLLSDPTNPELLRRLEKLNDEEYFWNLMEFYLYFSTWRPVKIFSNPEDLVGLMNPRSDIIFEGAQGVLLDRDYGFFPHVTQSNTSFRNAEELIRENNLSGEIIKIGIIRAYATRHGAGPFLTYNPELSKLIPDENNVSGPWQGEFQNGWLDLVALRYALKITGGIDGLALTNIDRLQNFTEIKVCSSYEYFGQGSLKTLEKYFELQIDDHNHNLIINGLKLTPADKLKDYVWRQEITDILTECCPIYETLKVNASSFTEDYVQYLEQKLNVKILITSHGPKAHDKKLVRTLTE